MSGPLLLRGARIVDPLSGRDERADVRVRGGRVSEVRPELEPGADERLVDLAGLLLTPGLVDVHVHLREPGQEEKETIASGAAAAAAGGFTTVCAMPNTDPVIDTPALVERVIEAGRAAAGARVRPIAAATVGSRGRRATDAQSLVEAGAVAISDDGRPIPDGVLADVLRAAEAAGVPLADHCEDLSLSRGGAVFASPLARRLGVGGIPPEAESAAVSRDLEALAIEGGRLHVCHVSTSKSVDHVRRAKARGLAVTAEATPHHLLLCVEDVAELGARAKMNPPLARPEDRSALRKALADGTIDCVASDHAPHTEEEKGGGLERAPFGVVGLETAFPLLYTYLVITKEFDIMHLIRRMSLDPARVFGLEEPRVASGAIADLAAFDLAEEWTVDPTGFRSRGRNTPFAGWKLRGRPVLTIVGGRVVFDGRGGARAERETASDDAARGVT